MPTTVFLSIRGEGASRVLESFRRALGEEAETLTVVPTNDDSGYHGSADVSDVAAAREAFAIARKPFPSLKGYLGAGGAGPRDRDEAFPRLASPGQPEPRSPRQPESRPRPTERSQSRPTERLPEARGRAAEPKGRGPEKPREKEAPPAEGAEQGRRRSPLRHRNRTQRRQTPDSEPTP